MKGTNKILIKITQEYNSTFDRWVTVKHYMC